MKKILVCLMLASSFSVGSRNYFINSISGSDQNDGLKPSSAFKTINKISELSLTSGDNVYLEGGQTFKGTIELSGINGSKKKPVTILSRGKGKAVVDAAGYPNGVLIRDCNNIRIENLHITADGGWMIREADEKAPMRCGVFITNTKAGKFSGFELDNLYIENVYWHNKGHIRDPKEVHAEKTPGKYSFGIRLITGTQGTTVSDIKITNCTITKVSHTGIKFTGRYQAAYFENLEVSNNHVTDVGGPGIQFSCANNAHVSYNYINSSGSKSDSRHWQRGSCLWTWGSSNFVIEHNSFINANGPMDSAGSHIDYYCKNIVIQYNLSRDNSGGFVEILGSNYNCCYRYNVSINDGFRALEKGSPGSQGKTLWLSGYTGKKRVGPFNSYVYNNTIYTKKDILPRMAIENTTVGVYIANNIFCLEGDAVTVLGDQYNPEKADDSVVRNVHFNNNLFLHKKSWPTDNIQDESAVYGDPEFANRAGSEIEDFIPADKDLIKRGIEVEKLPGDDIGLKIGLKVEKDILGNKIKGKPQMGAIFIK